MPPHSTSSPFAVRRSPSPFAVAVAVAVAGAFGCGAAEPKARSCASEPCLPAPVLSPRATVAEVRVSIAGMRERHARLDRGVSACPDTDQARAMGSEISAQRRELNEIEAAIPAIESDGHGPVGGAAARDIESRAGEIKEHAYRVKVRLELLEEMARRCR